MENSQILILCSSGFLFLCGCMFALARQLPDAKRISQDLREIKDALLGTMQKRGFISMLYDIVEDIKELKKKANP